MLRCGGYFFCSFISLLIGRKTINIPEIFSGAHGFTEKTANTSSLDCGNNKFWITCLEEVLWVRESLLSNHPQCNFLKVTTQPLTAEKKRPLTTVTCMQFERNIDTSQYECLPAKFTLMSNWLNLTIAPYIAMKSQM